MLRPSLPKRPGPSAGGSAASRNTTPVCGARVLKMWRARGDPPGGARARGFGREFVDVWACVLEANAWRRARQDAPLAGYQALCRELAKAGPGCFGELDSIGA